MDDLLKYILTFATALVIATVLTRVMITLGPKLGMIDIPTDNRRIHTKPIPRAGGIAVFVAFHVAALCLYLFFWPQITGGVNLPWWLAFFASSSLLLVVGLVDDIKGTKPLMKLLGQVAAASLLFTLSPGGGFSMLWGISIPWGLDWLLTVIWCVAIINAFNLIDGLDGLCSGLAIVSALGLAASSLLHDAHGNAVIILALIGACAGFLRYNFHPARIFLGDTGSMFIGFTLAAIALQGGGKSTFVVSMAIPFLAAGVPIMDTLLAIWRRSMRRIIASRTPGNGDAPKITSGDKDHLHHRLLAMGLSQRNVALILYSVNALLVVIGLLWVFRQKVNIGLFLIMFFAGIYVLVRHLMHVEIWDTGRVLVQGLKQPSRKLFTALLYPVCDLLWLSVTLVLAFAIDGNDFRGMSMLSWVKVLPVWVTPVFLALVLSKVYSRIWAYASFHDFLILCISMMLGVTVSFLINMLSHPESNIWLMLLRVSMLWFMLGWAGIFCLRAMVQILREWMLVGAYERKIGDHYKTTRILLYGAGDRASLYLRQIRVVNPELMATRQVVGLIDDDPALMDRYLQGHCVLGSVDDLERLIDKHHIDEVLVVTNLFIEHETQLRQIICNKGIFLSYWQIVQQEWSPKQSPAPAADAANTGDAADARTANATDTGDAAAESKA